MPVADEVLRQCQWLKRFFSKKHASAADLGELVQIGEKHTETPAGPDVPFVLWRELIVDEAKPRCAIAISTRRLMEQWVGKPSSICAMDTGYKFNPNNWGICLLGHTNGDAQLRVACAVFMSKCDQKAVVTSFKAFATRSHQLYGGPTDKRIGPIDQEYALRKSLRSAFNTSTKMCYLHIIQGWLGKLDKCPVHPRSDGRREPQAVRI